jgi:hypothetical protein
MRTKKTVLTGAALLCGCASVPTPTDRMEASAAAIRSAEELGAQKVPGAAFHLQLAKEQQELAKEKLDKGDKSQARWMLIRSQADAELSMALAREEHGRAAAQQSLQKVKELETDR